MANEIRDLIIEARKNAVRKMDLISKQAVDGLKQYIDEQQAKVLDEIDGVVKVVRDMAGIQAGVYEKAEPIAYVSTSRAPEAVMVKIGNQGITNLVFNEPNTRYEGYIVLRKAEKQPKPEAEPQ